MIKLKINTPLNGHKSGDIINLESDADGNIIDSFWARRLKDSTRDNCVEVVKSEQKESKKGNK